MQQDAPSSLSVTVIACGQIPGLTTLVYAIKVTQPVQTWTIVRSHDEFVSLDQIISPTFPDLPLLPSIKIDAGTVDIRTSASSIQTWLSKILTRPGVSNNVEVINFLTCGFNSIAPEYNNLPWVQFESESQPPRAHYVAPHHAKVDDMDMEDMFPDSRECSEYEFDGDDDDDEEDIPAASIRYRPTDEDVTNEDEMDLTGEVEMIDDIGSLAQSLGASHLGRSLQRQAEMGQFRTNKLPTEDVLPSGGLHIGGVSHRPNNGTGGIGSVLENAVNSAHAAQAAPPPMQTPRLDSFKIIRVIGKGSFGKHDET